MIFWNEVPVVCELRKANKLPVHSDLYFKNEVTVRMNCTKRMSCAPRMNWLDSNELYSPRELSGSERVGCVDRNALCRPK